MKLSERDVLLDPSNKEEKIKDYGFPHNSIRGGMTLVLIGGLALILGLRPDLVGADRGLYIGFIQIVMILVGLAFLSVGAYNTLNAFWTCTEKSLAADIGSRFIMTGFVICAFTALADAFGFGTNPPPLVILGTLQSQGVIIGMAVIILGLLMMIRWDRDRSHPIVKNCSNLE